VRMVSFALAVCWLVLIALPHSHSQPPPSLCAEQSYMCSTSVSAILDPFWEQIPQSQCRSPRLRCSARYESQNFWVKDMNNTSHTITVVPTHIVNNVCSPGFFEIYKNLNSSLLQYYASVHNVTVFFDGCPEIPGFPSKRKVMCLNGVHYFEEGYKEQEMLNTYPPLKDCKARLHVAIAAPLYQYDYINDAAGVLRKALKHGFEVYYALPPTCKRCSLSNPSCSSYDGYDQQLVSCQYYCSDQQCSPPKTSMSSIFSVPLICYLSLSQNSLPSLFSINWTQLLAFVD